jgi:hypothetical protein
MPTQVPEINTGNHGYGTVDLTLGGPHAATTYVCEDFQSDLEVNEVKVPNRVGKTAHRIVVQTDVVGTATLQFVSGSQIPVVGSTGSVPSGYAVSGSGILVTGVGVPRSMSDYVKMSINWVTLNP